MRAHMRVQPEQLARGRPAPQEWARIDPTVYVTEARRRQARAMADAIGAGWRGVRRALIGLAGLVQRLLLDPFTRRSQRHSAIAHLAALDNRLLADIGLRRSDIELAVDGRLADPRVTRREPAGAELRDHLRKGERCPAPAITANTNRPAAAQPDHVPDLAA